MLNVILPSGSKEPLKFNGDPVHGIDTCNGKNEKHKLNFEM